MNEMFRDATAFMAMVSPGRPHGQHVASVRIPKPRRRHSPGRRAGCCKVLRPIGPSAQSPPSEQTMTEPFGRLALHTWTVDTTPLATALDAARKAGYDAV